MKIKNASKKNRMKGYGSQSERGSQEPEHEKMGKLQT